MLKRAGKPGAELAAILAGFSGETAQAEGEGLLKLDEIQQYLNWLEQQEAYTLQEYFSDIELLQENLTGKIKPGNPGCIINPALFLKVIQMKAKLFDVDKVEITEVKSPPEERKNDIKKADLFTKIEERAHVFEKIRNTNA